MMEVMQFFMEAGRSAHVVDKAGKIFYIRVNMAKIISTKSTLGGKKRIAGTRISVDVIYNYVKDNAVDRISQDYPHLKRNQIQAALDYLDRQVHKSKEKFGATAA